MTSIGDYAFRNCSGLTSVTIGESVTTIGDYAFSCSGLKSIYSLNPEPPSCSVDWYGGVFHDVDKRACTLYVPEGSKTAYSTAYAWRDFYNIEEIDMSPLTVETYEATEITPTSATLNGRAVASYNEGITEQGFEYWTADAEEADTITAEGEDMSVTITDLTENTTYSYRAYVITEFDATRYGETLTFTTLYGSLHDTVTSETEEVRDSLGNVWSVVMTDYADVVDGFGEEYEALSDELERLAQGLDDAYNDGTLTEEYAEEVRQRLEEISTETGKMLDEAKEAESSYLYSTITGRIKEAESTLGETWNTILTDCPHVAEGYEDTRDAISDKLEELLQGVEETYKEGKLTKEATEETESALETIAKETEDMLAATKRAESDYLYAVVDDIKEVESLLSDIWETMEEECADVVDGFNSVHDAIAAELAELTQSVEEAHSQGGLTRTVATGITSSLEAIRQEIDDMLANAKAAENEYVYAMMDGIGEVEDMLDSAWETIETECADVMYNFKDDYDAIASELLDLRQTVEDIYKQGNLVTSMAETIANSLEAIKQEIEDMLTAAKTAESNYLYSIIYEIEEVEGLLSDAWTTITTECADVADDFTDAYESLAGELGGLRQSVEDAHSQGGLTTAMVEETRSGLEAIKREIDDMLATAKAAQGEAQEGEQEPDGIDGIISDYGDDVRIYNLAGSRVLAPERGNVYIFRYMDGTTRKVLVK